MPDGTLQFMARVGSEPTLWEQSEIVPGNPELDFTMRLLRCEARDAQQEAATQALAGAVLGTTVTVSGNEVRFWSAEGQPLRSPIIEKFLVVPSFLSVCIALTFWTHNTKNLSLTHNTHTQNKVNRAPGPK